MPTILNTDLEKQRSYIYNRFRRGWVRTKTIELHEFCERTGHDWDCIKSAHCKKRFGPQGHERCTNCLGMV
ncbi:MAG: hypothetical protein ACRDF4_03695 [Rhabdochlamydiaceae bacterium]